ncbi:glycoside hydrolase family 75 protein [Streptomyces hyaluromycini]|uniref:Glycoside hydrolase family 75 protein n=1 Tax=Streptomyces hyaluromycini TaxID=1377993 RepID=A0ABV1X1G7_9ACTN
MRIRTLTLAAASGAALLAAGVLPASASGASVPKSAQEGSVSAASLLAKVTSCSQISSGKYRTDDETSATIPVCGKNGAVFWKADMDIDCDGQRTTNCNENRDPWYQDDTAFHQSDGQPLKAESLPYIVVPSSSSIWNYSGAGIKGGGVVAVIYNNKVEYAVVGDTGPTNIIGEASYATANALGIDPDPATGGADSGVTYILFKNSKVSPIESHSAAVSLGDQLAKQFLANN